FRRSRRCSWRWHTGPRRRHLPRSSLGHGNDCGQRSHGFHGSRRNQSHPRRAQPHRAARRRTSPLRPRSENPLTLFLVPKLQFMTPTAPKAPSKPLASTAASCVTFAWILLATFALPSIFVTAAVLFGYLPLRLNIGKTGQHLILAWYLLLVV